MKKIISIILLYILLVNQASAGIFLYSVMPNTTDDTNLEYIELYNSGTGKVNLDGYKIKDKSNKTFQFGSGEYIETNSTKKYYRPKTKILLNNTNEELYLYDNSGDLLDSFSYTISTKGKKINIYSQTINNNSGSLSNSGLTQTGVLTNSGVINSSGSITNSGSISNSGALNNSGTTNTGNLINSGSLSNSGVITNTGTISNSGALTNTGSSQTGTINTGSGITNSGSTNSGIINSGSGITSSGTITEKINLIYEFQNPSYITDKTPLKEKYICDDSKDECKLNLNLENSFSGNIKKSNYECEIDFGLKGGKTGEENKCNPSTIIFPKGVFNIKMKIISKNDSSIYSEKSFILENNIKAQIIEKEKIVYKDKICPSNSNSSSSSSSHSNTTRSTNNNSTNTSIILNKPLIKIQSGIKNGKCTKTDCNVNLIYETNNSNIKCQWDFGAGTFKTPNTDKKCNPGYVHYNLGNHKISLKIYNKYNPNNYKISYLNFSNPEIPKIDNKIDNTRQIIDKQEKPLNTEKEISTKDKVDIVDKKEDNKSGTGLIQKETIKKEEKIENKKINNTKEKYDLNIQIKSKKPNKKIILPYFMDSPKTTKQEKQIILQGRLGNKILSGSSIKCFDKCSINLVAKDNKNIRDYFWDFGNGQTFKGANPSYVKYNKIGKYTITLTTFTKNGIKNTEKFIVNYQEKPKITKLVKKKVSKKKKYKKSKSKTKKKEGIYLTKEKLYGEYIPKKELNKNYIEKSDIGSYCSDIKYFPEIINKFKILILFLIGLVIVLGGFIVLKKRELI